MKHEIEYRIKWRIGENENKLLYVIKNFKIIIKYMLFTKRKVSLLFD